MERLRDALDRHGYAIGCRMANPTAALSPWPNYDLARNAVALMNAPIKPLLALLYLGIPTAQSALTPVFGGGLASRLEKAGLIKRQDDMFLPQKIVIPYRGLYLIVDIPPFYPPPSTARGGVYLGTDSFLLGDLLPTRRNARILDLCCGSAVHALVMARRNNRITAVDIDPDAVNVAALNARLNGVGDIVRCVHGDLFDAVADTQTYDLIVTKPPCQPIPDFLPEYPRNGQGGEDGLGIMRRILHDAPEHLAPTGRLIGILQLLGNDRSVPFVEEMAAYAQDRGLDLGLFITGRTSSARYVDLMSAYVPTVAPERITRWKDAYRRAGFSYLYDAVLTLDNGGGGTLEKVTQFFLSDDTVLEKMSARATAHLMHDTDLPVLHEKVVTLCDGSRTVGEIKSRLKDDLAQYGENPDDIEHRIDGFAHWLVGNGLTRPEGL